MAMKTADTVQETNALPTSDAAQMDVTSNEQKPPKELNGPKGPEPTRFGDWERKGRCVDF